MTDPVKPKLCPRRFGPNFHFPGPDTWGPGDDCSYCGSIDPDTFMARLEAGDIELGPTDKSAKVYVHNRGGTRIGTKFYWAHLSLPQKIRFIELLNGKMIHIGDPGYFYVRPFFIAPPGP